VSTTQQGDAVVAELGGELLRVLGRSLAHIQGVAAPEPEALYRFLAAIGTLVVFNDVMVAVRDPPPACVVYLLYVFFRKGLSTRCRLRSADSYLQTFNRLPLTLRPGAVCCDVPTRLRYRFPRLLRRSHQSPLRHTAKWQKLLLT
jgi:hypothetical protein